MECHCRGAWTDFCEHIDLFQLIYLLVIDWNIKLMRVPILTIWHTARWFDSINSKAACSNSNLQKVAINVTVTEAYRLINENKSLFITSHTFLIESICMYFCLCAWFKLDAIINYNKDKKNCKWFYKEKKRKKFERVAILNNQQKIKNQSLHFFHNKFNVFFKFETLKCIEIE